MRRQKQDPVLDLIPAVAGFLLLGLYFVPAFRFLMFAALIVFVLAILVFVIYRLVIHEPHVEIPDRIISIDTYQPSSAPAPVPTPSSPYSPPPPKPAPPQSLADKLHKIDWFQFEKLVGAIYQAKGFSVQRLGGAKPDGGIDLIIEQAGVKTAIQCKHRKDSEVPVSDMREFLGALKDHEFQNGIFITLHGYTSDAQALAAKHKIQILRQPELTAMLESLDWQYNPAIQSALDPNKKICPKCERQMVLRTARRGSNRGSQFWSCSAYPRCRAKLTCA